MGDVLNNNTFLDKFKDTCFTCVKHLPKTHRRHKLFNVNSKENSVLCGYFLKLYNLDIDLTQVNPKTRVNVKKAKQNV